MKKVVWCLSLALAMPSMAFSADKRDGTYYCTATFAGGIGYDNKRKQWEGATFEHSKNFVMKLSFRETVKGQTRDDEYDVTITDEGSSDAYNCFGFDGNPPFLTHDRDENSFELHLNTDPLQIQFR